MKRILLLFGTRPEAIKMAPLVRPLRAYGFDVRIGLTGQHRDMVYPILDLFGLKVDFDLKIAPLCQKIEDLLSYGVKALCEKLREEPVDMILVHGDTSSTLAGGLSGFYLSIPVAHVEAGLRSHSMAHPFPEEANRKLVAALASMHFAPTQSAALNLEAENVPSDKIVVTGNTVVDATYLARDILIKRTDRATEIKGRFDFMDSTKKWILLTGHRRENLNDSLYKVVQATRDLAVRCGAQVVFPRHPNPVIAEILRDFSDHDTHLKQISALSYEEMTWLYSQVSLIVTDSGGIQEEAASYGLPVLVTRKVTERKESIGLGRSHIVGDSAELIATLGSRYLLFDHLQVLPETPNPYGDGLASERISQAICRYFEIQTSRTMLPEFRLVFGATADEQSKSLRGAQQ